MLTSTEGTYQPSFFGGSAPVSILRRKDSAKASASTMRENSGSRASSHEQRHCPTSLINNGGGSLLHMFGCIPHDNSTLLSLVMMQRQMIVNINNTRMNWKGRRAAIFLVGTLFAAILAAPCESLLVSHHAGMKSTERIGHDSTRDLQRRLTTGFFMSSTKTETAESQSFSIIQTYEHDGWTLSYRYKPASRGYESQAPLLLIHPVGIGLSSWFWNNLFECWEGPELYAPDLIGCGIKNGGDAYDPDKRGLFFPLSWVQGCEALMQTRTPATSVLNLLPIPSTLTPTKSRSWNVVCQGGLAPVGVMLAARNPTTVSKLVLTSPPSWKDMTTPIPEAELSWNYNFLRNPLVEPLAFGILETRWAIEYFSNLFLFANQCDQQWLELACDEIATESRPPVAAFNAGFCNHRSFQEELETLTQPTLILSGDDDGRASERKEYASKMIDCTLLSLSGKNVLPWEAPKEVCEAVKDFCY